MSSPTQRAFASIPCSRRPLCTWGHLLCASYPTTLLPETRMFRKGDQLGKLIEQMPVSGPWHPIASCPLSQSFATSLLAEALDWPKLWFSQRSTIFPRDSHSASTAAAAFHVVLQPLLVLSALVTSGRS